MKLISLFKQGLVSPLPFFPETSGAYVTSKLKGEPIEQTIYKTLLRWNGDNFQLQGEYMNSYFNKSLFR